MDNTVLPESEHASILIVDDNPHNLQVLGKLLNENKYRVEFAINGEAALEWIKKKSFDLVLLDINMPGMNGFEVCATIRSNRSLDRIPIIFLSAETERESILQGFELGAQDYITKPFDSRELLSRVKTHLTLKESLEKLGKQNIILEATVAERTEQLRKAIEQLKELNLKLFDLDKAKSEFLHLVSHEIRTPLNGIIGSIELLKKSGAAWEVGELIEMLDLSVKRLEKFSMNALLITQLKTKPSDIRKEPVSLAQLIDDLLKENAEKLGNRRLHIQFNNTSETSIINGEPELVKIGLGNILDNAISFSPLDGKIEIRMYDEGENIVCEFKDNGAGFQKDAGSKVFEMFSMGDIKLDNSPGIGLPISKLITEAHSGEMKIGNNPDGGAFVKLSFSVS